MIQADFNNVEELRKQWPKVQFMAGFHTEAWSRLPEEAREILYPSQPINLDLFKKMKAEAINYAKHFVEDGEGLRPQYLCFFEGDNGKDYALVPIMMMVGEEYDEHIIRMTLAGLFGVLMYEQTTKPNDKNVLLGKRLLASFMMSECWTAAPTDEKDDRLPSEREDRQEAITIDGISYNWDKCMTVYKLNTVGNKKFISSEPMLDEVLGEGQLTDFQQVTSEKLMRVYQFMQIFDYFKIKKSPLATKIAEVLSHD